MKADPSWNEFTPEDWRTFARFWIASLRNPDTSNSEIGESVVMMNFTATPEQQWQFILAALAEGSSDTDLAHIGAGPLQHLLGWHGEEYIDVIEQEVQQNRSLARALNGVRKYLMKDQVWARVQSLRHDIA